MKPCLVYNITISYILLLLLLYPPQSHRYRYDVQCYTTWFEEDTNSLFICEKKALDVWRNSTIKISQIIWCVYHILCKYILLYIFRMSVALGISYLRGGICPKVELLYFDETTANHRQRVRQLCARYYNFFNENSLYSYNKSYCIYVTNTVLRGCLRTIPLRWTTIFFHFPLITKRKKIK